MKKAIFIIVAVLAAALNIGLRAQQPATEAVADAHAIEAPASESSGGDSALPFDTKEIIFDHLGDAYGWEVPFDHHHRIPLPCILYSSETGLHIFSSARITDNQSYVDNGVEFKKAGPDSPYENKIVAIVDGRELRPWDFSITKNVCALFISVVLVLWMVLSIARWYKGGNAKAPRGIRGGIEVVITFIYDSVIKPTLGKESMRFAPYLLSVFMFILVMNLTGLMVIFPGGANLTGNIAVTLVLALITFFITNLFGTKHYWKEIFWPDVPLWLKCPIPIMQVIEVFGIFTKPAALTVRLFANMMGGHMIVIVLTLLIFIFHALFGSIAVASGTAVVSILFSVFMLVIDVLVSFIQAYVFTMLSTVFIGLARENGEHEHGHETTVEAAVKA